MPISYTLHPNRAAQPKHQYYSKEDLQRMTTYQLQEICREEKIINGILSPLDKDALIYQILRFRGREDRLFITEYSQERMDAIEKVLQTASIHFHPKEIRGCAKLIVYEGISMEVFDRFTIGYEEALADTNAVLVSDGELCAIFQIRAHAQDTDRLYITKSQQMHCKEARMKNYVLYCMDRTQSDLFYRLYQEHFPQMPEHLSFYAVPVLMFEVRGLVEASMPLAIDFGTSNTTAGMYLDDAYFEKIAGDPITETLKVNDVNYLYHWNSEQQAVPTLPTVVGVTAITEDGVQYVFGHQANRLFHMSYLDDGFCVFYDIKRFVSEPDKLEEIVDQNGHRSFVERREILKAYLEYVISCARQRLKCKISHLHISAPVKQKKLFHRLFQEILPDYVLESRDMLDEGVAVLYNSISELIHKNQFVPGEPYRALIIDCGGGTTDLSSCTFSIQNKRVSYQIDICTSYENGDTDFGGNNLTYRIMQFIKLALAYELSDMEIPSLDELMESFDLDIFREVDQMQTPDVIYSRLEEEYRKAEAVIPTRFRDYEHRSHSDYYAVKNNFYYLFHLAEKVKNEFYRKTGTLRIALSTIPLQETAAACIQADRWKLYWKQQDTLTVLKDFPTIYLSIYQINLLLKADIYGIVRKFIGALYDSGELHQFAILRLTGQSCKIELFREALKEFIPGKMIASTGRNQQSDSGYALKLVCLNGAVQYLKDKTFGYADIRISHEKAAFPYAITAYTHAGEEKELINGMQKQNRDYGFISRNMADVTLKLFLKDPQGDLRYTYSLKVEPKTFDVTDADSLVNEYSGRIPQDHLDDIVEREMKFFILSQESDWGFSVIPVYRLNGQLHSSQAQFFSFETEGWLMNFFDGTR